MGAAASVDERAESGGVMQLLRLKPKELAARATAEGKDPVVAKTIRKHKLTAAKAVDLADEDVDKLGLAPLDRLKFEAALEQIKFALDASRARQRLAELATRDFGGVRQLFAQLELKRRRSMSIAWFSRALQRLNLHGEFPRADQEMVFRAIHADATKEMFFSQIVAVEELVAWLEACPEKGDTGYVPADYVDPPELEEVTQEAPRVDAARISRVRETVGTGGFGDTIVSAAKWQQSWKKKKLSVALKCATEAAHGTDVAPAELFALRERPNPFLQKFFGVTSVNGVLNVIMELGWPLAEAMQQGLRQDPLAVVRAARDMALGLGFLHKEGFPHLALHPNNVLLKGRRNASDDVAMALKHARDENGGLNFQLTDHGGGLPRAARRAGAGSHYAAPELLHVQSNIALRTWQQATSPSDSGKSRSWQQVANYKDLLAAPEPCDAWSYGSVLLELLTGKAPWSELSDEALVAEAARGAPPPLPDKNWNAELLDKAREFLDVDPGSRPRFDDKLAGDLDLLLLIAAVNAPPAKGLVGATKRATEIKKMRHLIEVEIQKDADAYQQAWEACEREVTRYDVANLKATCADLQEYFTPPKKEDLRQPVPVKTAKELVAMASAASKSFHETLRPLVERAGGTYEKGPRKIAERIDAKAEADYGKDVGAGWGGKNPWVTDRDASIGRPT